MKKILTVLVADDDGRHRAMLDTLLQEWGYAVMEARDGDEAVNLCLSPPSGGTAPDLALIDVRMPGKSGLEILNLLKSSNPHLPVLMMTAYSEVQDAVEAIRKGAYDYLLKPLDFEKLRVALRNAAAQLGLERQNARLEASLADLKKQPSMLGNSPAMAAIAEMIKAVAPTEATILISGESGTGKELAARAIHDASNRSKGPFVAINCGALTGSLLASELFGHEKGAFTGADKKHPGLFLEATGGSIFLDEIGEMPMEMQVKLLRVLQEREILSVGGKKPQSIDCRIIAATNRDLAREVENGAFREDLYYRLNVISLQMPPLRDRREDIPILANNFAARFASANHKHFTAITGGAMRLLQAAKWPGNVRELENVMERAIILMRGEYISEHELPDSFRMMTQETEENEGSKFAVTLSPDTFGDIPTLEEVEREVIMRALEKLGNNKTEAAKALGITRKTLHAKLNRYKEDDA